MLRQARNLVAVKFAAVRVHAGVRARGIVAEHPVKDKQPFQNVAPGNLGNLPQAPNRDAGSLLRRAVGQSARTADRNLLQQYQLHGWNQGSEFREVKDRGLLKRLEIGHERGFAELKNHGAQESFRNGQDSRDYIKAAIAGMGNSSNLIQLLGYAVKF